MTSSPFGSPARPGPVRGEAEGSLWLGPPQAGRHPGPPKADLGTSCHRAHPPTDPPQCSGNSLPEPSLPAGPFCSLLGRHLRLHRHLLALWRHTLALPHAADPAAWATWIEQRQRLLANLRACDGPRLTADTQALLHSPGDGPRLTADTQALLHSPGDGPRLTADTQALLHSPGDDPLSSSLRALQQRELSLMQSLLSLERLLLRALNAQRVALSRRLLSAQRAGAACSAYRRRARPPLAG